MPQYDDDDETRRRETRDATPAYGLVMGTIVSYAKIKLNTRGETEISFKLLRFRQIYVSIWKSNRGEIRSIDEENSMIR